MIQAIMNRDDVSLEVWITSSSSQISFIYRNKKFSSTRLYSASIQLEAVIAPSFFQNEVKFTVINKAAKSLSSQRVNASECLNSLRALASRLGGDISTYYILSVLTTNVGSLLKLLSRRERAKLLFDENVYVRSLLS